jgi:hypothetical protein
MSPLLHFRLPYNFGYVKNFVVYVLETLVERRRFNVCSSDHFCGYIAVESKGLMMPLNQEVSMSKKACKLSTVAYDLDPIR